MTEAFVFSTEDVEIPLPDPITFKIDNDEWTAECPKLDMWVQWYRADPAMRPFVGRDLVMASLINDPGRARLERRLADPRDKLDLPIMLAIADKLTEAWQEALMAMWKAAGMQVAELTGNREERRAAKKKRAG